MALTHSAQRELAVLSDMPRPALVDAALLATVASLLEAIHLCIHLSKLAHWTIAERVGIDRGHWARILQGKANLPANKFGLLMQVCGNYAPLQWLAAWAGFQLYEDAKAKRRAELEAELARLEA